MDALSDESFMREALHEAAKGLGQTSPNPAVGAVLVIDGKVAARGHHRRAGEPHAEIECLSNYGARSPNDATLYVTLEPCSTSGRTPACTEAVVAAGIKKVVIGAIDPNPKHSGRGIQLLRNAGVIVRERVLETECTALNEAFNKWIRTREPFVIAKCGMTLDGRLTCPPQDGRWITSAAAREHANRFRAQVDAILIGAETLRADNPRLTIRGDPDARQPWRVVLSRSGRLPKTARLFTDRFANRTLVFHDESLPNVLSALGEREITSVLIEGGGNVLGQALDARLIDKLHLYVAPLFCGGPVVAFSGRGAALSQDAMRLRNVRYEQIGSDIFISAKATYDADSSE